MKIYRTLARIAAGTAFVLAILFVLHHKPWKSGRQARHGELTVGFLPVTCHLTCPVTDFATKTTTTSTRPTPSNPRRRCICGRRARAARRASPGSWRASRRRS